MSAVSELARKLAEAVPNWSDGASAARSDLERNFRSLLENALERMDLVTREEFDIQRRVLERTRDKLTALEKQVAELEARDGATD